MSHYVVAVIVPAEQVGREFDAEALVEPFLAPYDENDENCEHPKWDWWVVGGRWAGFLVDKDGNKRDYLRARDFDFKARFDEAVELCGKYYDQLHEAMAPHPPITPWPHVVAQHPGDIDAARRDYSEQPGVKAALEVVAFDATPEQIANDFAKGRLICPFDSLEDWLDDRDTVARRMAFEQAGFFAIVDREGWHATGEMGWFGLSKPDGNRDGYVSWGVQTLTELDPDDLIVVCDLHI